MALQPGTSRIFAGASPVQGVFPLRLRVVQPPQAVLPAFRALAEEVSRIGELAAGTTTSLSVSASRSISEARTQIGLSAFAEGIEGKLFALSTAIVDGLHGVSSEVASLRVSPLGEYHVSLMDAGVATTF